MQERLCISSVQIEREKYKEQKGLSQERQINYFHSYILYIIYIIIHTYAYIRACTEDVKK